VSAISIPGVNSIATDNRRAVQMTADFLMALGCRVRGGIRTAGDLMERRFAEFARVPYYNPNSRQEWEDLLETDAE
jgi:DNA-binding LacI/PurR family transcriptional regulator